jgi:hypothetical protein
MAKTSTEIASEESTAGKSDAPQIHWDDENMSTSYANVCNVASTREEVTLLFGTNQTWDSGSGSKDLTIKLSDRIILNPYAAKRLMMLLENVIGQYEARFGKLGGDAGAGGGGAAN